MNYRIKKVHDTYTVEERVLETYFFKKDRWVWRTVNASMFVIEGKPRSHPFRDINHAWNLIKFLEEESKRKNSKPEYIYYENTDKEMQKLR